MRGNRRFACRYPTAFTAALLLAACASGGPGGEYATTVRVEPEAAPPESLPPLPVPIIEDGQDTELRIQHLDVFDQDLRLVVRSLAESFGLAYQMDPAVSGRVTARLRDVTLAEALDELILPQGFTYTLQETVLRVVPARLATRIFSLDYVSLSRFAVGSTVVQRRLGPAGGIGGIGGIGTPGVGGQIGGGIGGGGGADVIQTVTVADLWEEIRVSLEALIFDATGTVAAPGAVGPTGQQPIGQVGGGRGPTAFSRVGPEGRRLIINPLAGTILVSAPPSKLEEVATLLTAIEGSVHRQVNIEARIVEVSLNRQFEYGIDWNAITRIGGINIRIMGGGEGAQLAIGTGPEADREIGIVLRALETQGRVNVLSAPRVSVMNNQRATINVATDEVFFSVTRQPVIGPTGGTIGFETQIVPQQIAVGIVLDVLAQIAADNIITLNVRPVITDVVEVREVRLPDGTQASAPVIDRRETDTMVRVRGGETIVIGGLMRSMERTQETGVPGLRRIPGLGRLFGGYRQQEEKRELVIFITPTIVAGQPPIAQP